MKTTSGARITNSAAMKIAWRGRPGCGALQRQAPEIGRRRDIKQDRVVFADQLNIEAKARRE